MSINHLQDAFEMDYTENEVPVPIWTTEQLEVFNEAGQWGDIGFQLSWMDPAILPKDEYPALDPRSLGLSSEDMLGVAMWLVHEADIPLQTPDIHAGGTV
jgi:hypothetical protein